jgi:MarR family transcriptional regulator, temperature-dependent positive regulator of motility
MFDHCLYFNTTALARRLEREWAAAFEPFDLSPPQGFLLRAILATPGVPQRELAATLAIARPTATRALDQLSEKGFVERRPSAGDGREVFIFPTDKASEIQVRLNAASGQVTHRLKRVLGQEVFEETVDKVRGVRSALK